MTVHVPGASVITRKPRWKQLLLPEIPATRLSCFTSGSFRPKVGLGILFLLLTGCILLVIVPFLTPTVTSFIAARSAKSMEFNKEAVASIAKSNAKFGMDLFSSVAKPEENLIMSSYSVSSVLSMILHGAGGNTALELRQGLALTEDKDYAVYKEGFKDVLNLLKSNENFTLNAANRIYHSTDNHVDKSYITSTQEYFLADPQGLDFSQAQEASNTINQWVEEQTKEKIKDLVKPDMLNALTKLVLVNAIYFKGDWEQKFDKKHTRKGDFHVTPDHVVQVDMMFNSKEYAMTRVKELDGAFALNMPYKGERLSMILVLPAEGKTLLDLEKNMSKIPNINEVLKFGTRKVKVELTLPKFKLESQIELNEPLKALGMKDMFDQGKADFSGMTGGPKSLFVSAVVQKAFVEVNEEGAEAAAATAGMMMMRAMPMNPIFNCDRPFMFFIRDNLTNMMLFSGHVTDPSSK